MELESAHLSLDYQLSPRTLQSPQHSPSCISDVTGSRADRAGFFMSLFCLIVTIATIKRLKERHIRKEKKGRRQGMRGEMATGRVGQTGGLDSRSKVNTDVA